MDLTSIYKQGWVRALDVWMEKRDLGAFALAVYQYHIPKDAGTEEAVAKLREELVEAGVLEEHEQEVPPDTVDAVADAIVAERTGQGHDWPALGGKELAHLVIGGVPFHCAVMPDQEDRGAGQTCMLELLEVVGNEEEITGDAMTYFNAHTVLHGKDTGERHVTTNRRVFEF